MEGLVAFTDILGYQQLDVDSKKLADSLFSKMANALQEKHLLIGSFDLHEWLSDEQLINETISSNEQERERAMQEAVNENIAVSMISDSFVCVVDLSKNNEDQRKLLVSAFVKIVAAYNSALWREGLVLRGGISYGEFYTNTPLINNPSAYMGKAIMRAHDAEGDIEAVCICAEERAVEILKRYYDVNAASIFIDSNAESELCTAQVYSKKYGIQERLCINLPLLLRTEKLGDLMQYVAGLFASYNREITGGTISAKISNTVRFLKSAKPWPVAL